MGGSRTRCDPEADHENGNPDTSEGVATRDPNCRGTDTERDGNE
jgi:hypothetical protein